MEFQNNQVKLLEDYAKIPVSFCRVRAFLMDLRGMNKIRKSKFNKLIDGLKKALMAGGGKSGLSEIEALIGSLFRRDELSKNHREYLLKDVSVLKRAEF